VKESFLTYVFKNVILGQDFVTTQGSMMFSFLKISLVVFMFFLVGTAFVAPQSFSAGAEVWVFSFVTTVISGVLTSLGLLDGGSANAHQAPSQKIVVVTMAENKEAPRIIRLKNGIAVFKECDGKTISRFYLCVPPKT
jgi:hypothetical protein